MKRFCRFVVGIILAGVTSAPAMNCELVIRHVVAVEPLQLGSLRYDNSRRENFSVTRLSYLLSAFAFQGEDGAWLELTNHVAWMDAEKERTLVSFNLPKARFRAVRFSVGLNGALNHADAAQFAPDHPLNANLNGLHWGWQGGYIFMAVEGLWRNRGAIDGFSFHLAGDSNCTPIVLPWPLTSTNHGRIEVDFDIATLLNAPRPISFERDGSSTHSRAGDVIAPALVNNLSTAFRVRNVGVTASSAARQKLEPRHVPKTFTPYRLAIAASFPKPNLPNDNPLTQERVALGERLFHERLLSRDGTISCASCHDRRTAFADARRFSVGVSHRVGTRNAMPLFNLAWKSVFFWDGRAASLREQALMPIQDHNEMAQSLTNAVAALEGSCRELFTRAFGSPEITAEKIGLALECFLLTLTSFDSKFDRSIAGSVELTAEEKHGFELFMTEYDPRRGQYGADCFHCHGGPLFQSQSFANNGLDAAFKDAGRANVTRRRSDAGKFSTPSLRNVAQTAPYMHDGRFATLAQVIEHYSSGVQRSETLDPNLAKHPDGGLHLSAEDKRALVVFLETLTDNKFSQVGPRLTSSR
jgi:cytochrome c peroxidase